MSLTDLKFFTNEPERDLYSRFAAILRSNTQFFDVLPGLFRGCKTVRLLRKRDGGSTKGLRPHDIGAGRDIDGSSIR